MALPAVQKDDELGAGTLGFHMRAKAFHKLYVIHSRRINCITIKNILLCTGAFAYLFITGIGGRTMLLKKRTIQTPDGRSITIDGLLYPLSWAGFEQMLIVIVFRAMSFLAIAYTIRAF